MAGTTRLADSWQNGARNVTGLAWDEDRAEVTLQPRPFQFAEATKNVRPEISDRRGAGRDRYGNWYWISKDGRQIRVYSAGSNETTNFWPTGEQPAAPNPEAGMFVDRDRKPDPVALSFGGLAVTDDHYLVVGVLKGESNPAGILVFDLHARGGPMHYNWPDTVEFTPFDMAPAPGGGVWILDREQARYWRLDANFQVVNHANEENRLLTSAQLDDFQPTNPAPGDPPRSSTERRFPAGLWLNASGKVFAWDPISIEALPDRTVLILDRGPQGANFSTILRYHFGDPQPQVISLEDATGGLTLGDKRQPKLVAHDLAFLAHYTELDGSEVNDRLFVTSSVGDQTFIFRLDRAAVTGEVKLVFLPEHYYPMRLFGGKALVAADNQVYYDFGESWAPLMEQRRPRYVVEATLCSHQGLQGFDGREPDCVWHRLLLDACIPQDCQVEVWSRTANELADLGIAPWQEEPPLLYHRPGGSELPFAGGTLPKADETWELLFQNAQGRYLQLKLRLSGNGRATPRLRALRVYYPRFSYLTHYLPAIYREEPQSAWFLDRFLANVEGIYTSIEDRIASVQTLLDPISAPTEALDWLAHWFGLALDPAWDDAKKRLLIQHAMIFFQYRGTIRGIKMALRLALDDCADPQIFDLSSEDERIRVIERFRTRQTAGVFVGDATDPGGLIASTGMWKPADGARALHQRYKNYLVNNGLAASDTFPIYPPSVGSAGWEGFARETLGFVPSAQPSDKPLWQQFLHRRYQSIEALNRAYGLEGAYRLTSFTDASLFPDLPDDLAALQDWYQFERYVLPMYRTAHRFTVLIPTPTLERLSESQIETAIRERRELAKRIVDLEKPAHTTFEVKFYWALFRIGEARLGTDTLIDKGSRDSRFMSPMILNEGHLSEAYLAPGHPQNIKDRKDRRVLGRVGWINAHRPSS